MADLDRAPAVHARELPVTRAGAADLVLPTGHADLGPGPWTQAFWAHIDGPVRSKANYRHKGKVRWSDITDYEDFVYAQARAARPTGWDLGSPAAEVEDRPKVVCALVARSMLDTGNLSKSVLDACQGVLYVTDAQVIACTEVVHRTTAAPGLLAAFARLDVGADTRAALAASGQLQAAVADLLDNR